MKTLLTFLTLLAFVTPSFVLRADDGQKSANLRAILVSASPKGGETDRRLAPYEATLRRILRFESFRHLGEGRATLAFPGEASLSLGQGHSLALESENAKGGLRVQVSWTEGGRSLMRTGLVLRPGVPAVLGGPPQGKDGEVLAVIVIAE
jgi:hypothetical protein